MSWKAKCFTWKAKRLELVDSDGALQQVCIALLVDSCNLRKVLLHTQKGGNVESYSSQETAVPAEHPSTTMRIIAETTPANWTPL